MQEAINFPRQPLYQQVEKIIRQEILSNKMENISESIVVQRFKISNGTARRVLNNLESQGLLFRKAGRKSIVPTMAEIKHKELGIVFIDIDNRKSVYLDQIIDAIEARSKSLDYRLHLYSTRSRNIAEDQNSLLHDNIVRHKIHGLFLVSPISAQDVGFILQERIPCVSINNRYPGLPLPVVAWDFEQATFETGRRLLALNRRRWALITTPAVGCDVKQNSQCLLDAYRHFIEQENLSANPAWVQCADTTPEGGRQAMTALANLPADRRPDAILVCFPEQNAGVRDFMACHPEWQPLVIYTAIQPGEYPVYWDLSAQPLGQKAFDILAASFRGQTSSDSVLLPLRLVWS